MLVFPGLVIFLCGKVFKFIVDHIAAILLSRSFCSAVPSIVSSSTFLHVHPDLIICYKKTPNRCLIDFPREKPQMLGKYTDKMRSETFLLEVLRSSLEVVDVRPLNKVK